MGIKTPAVPPTKKDVAITKLTVVLKPDLVRVPRTAAGKGLPSPRILEVNKNAVLVQPQGDGSAADQTTKDTTKNPPTTLIRGGGIIELECDAPAGQTVDWKVEPVGKTSGVPGIEPFEDGKKARLKTDQSGLFAVSATSGKATIFWNVVFVGVSRRLGASSLISTRNDVFRDRTEEKNKRREEENAAAEKRIPKGKTDDVETVNFQAGDFPPPVSGQEKKKRPQRQDMTSSMGAIGSPTCTGAEAAEVNIVLTGGGPDGKLGIDDVRLRIIQNGIEDTLQGNYDDGGVVKEKTLSGLPVLDASTGIEAQISSDLTINWDGPFVENPGDSQQEPFLFLAPSIFNVRKNSDGSFVLRTLDSPEGDFPSKHPNTGKKIQSISGVNKFRTGIASVSKHAKNMIVVHADWEWTVTFNATVSHPFAFGFPTLDLKNSNVVLSRGITEISPGTGGQPATEAGWEIFPPIYLGGGTVNEATP